MGAKYILEACRFALTTSSRAWKRRYSRWLGSTPIRSSRLHGSRCLVCRCYNMHAFYGVYGLPWPVFYRETWNHHAPIPHIKIVDRGYRAVGGVRGITYDSSSWARLARCSCWLTGCSPGALPWVPLKGRRANEFVAEDSLLE